MPEIRLVDESDARSIQRIYAPYVRNTSITFERSPPSIEELKRQIKEKEEEYPWLVCEHDDSIAGYAYAGSIRKRAAYQWSVESSVYVDHDFHRRGVARGLYERLLAVLSRQGYYNVY
jgi:phosphinothricin acetyltransferase